MNKNLTAALFILLAAGCSTSPKEGPTAPPMDPSRNVSEQDCSRPVDTGGGNLMCVDAAEAERRAKARKEAEERAARERTERERAEQLARDEAARKQRAADEEAARKARAAEEERLAAEAATAAAAAAAARKAQEERERQEKLAAEAEAKKRAEQEAREAAERECRRLEQERSDGRAHLADFVGKYGQVDEFKGIAGQITSFLDRASKPKPCP